MLFNKRTDEHSDPLVDTQYFNEALNGMDDHVFVTFIALEEKSEPEAWEEEEESFLMVPLPYDELTAENAREMMKTQLIKQLELLSWLDVEDIQAFVEVALDEEELDG